MQAIQTQFPGLALLLDLNWDRALYVGTIALALVAGANIGAVLY